MYGGTRVVCICRASNARLDKVEVGEVRVLVFERLDDVRELRQGIAHPHICIP